MAADGVREPVVGIGIGGVTRHDPFKQRDRRGEVPGLDRFGRLGVVGIHGFEADNAAAGGVAPTTPVGVRRYRDARDERREGQHGAENGLTLLSHLGLPLRANLPLFVPSGSGGARADYTPAEY